MSSKQKRPVQVFFSYARRDKTLRERLEEHLSNLKYQGLITTWHNRDITAGEDWIQQVDIHLDKADIILLLISSSFMASDYCYSIEMKRALERHKKREARVIPILLRPVVYDGAPFAHLQFLPTNGKPVVDWTNRDRAFVDIALGIKRVVEEYHAPKIPTIAITPPPLPTQQFNPATIPPATILGLPSPHGWAQQYGSPPLPRSRAQNPLKRLFLSFSRIGLVLLVLVGLVTAIILLAQHPQAIPLVAASVGGLLLLIGMIVVVLVLRKRAQERRAREQARQVEQQRLEEEQRRQRRQEEERRQQEALLRQQEIERQRARERDYYIQTLEAYEKALHRNPYDITALKGMGNALVGLGRFDEALEAFNQAISYHPTPSIYERVGDVFFKLNRYEEALVAYDKAIQLHPTFASAYAGKAVVLEQLGRSWEAQYNREQARQLGYEED